MFNHLKWVVTTIGALLLVSSCRHSKPNVIYMPDMVYSPAIKAQQEGGMRIPPAGTVPVDFEPYPYLHDSEAAGKNLKNFLRPTKETLLRGQHIYETYCVVCHGHQGEGDGYVVPKFPRPPSLQSDKIRNYPDGGIYHIITAGQNLMPSYASQIRPGDRWAVIHYLRVLQKAKHPSADEIQKIEQELK